jgi:hypothetical protein
MTEQFSEFQQFDRAALTAALGVDATPTRDVAFGEGHRFAVGDGRAELEVFPAAGVARVTTHDARLELHRLPGYTTHDETHRVVFEQGEPDERTRLTVRDDGRVSFIPVLRASEAPQDTRPADSTQQVVNPPSAGSERPTAPQSSTPDNDRPESAEQAAEHLQGRLGRNPWFSTRDDRPAAGFPLAVNPIDGGKATWHDVVTFDETAGKLHEAFEKRQITKGKLVDVVGQPVVVDQPRANGGVKQTREFHATAVRRV